MNMFETYSLCKYIVASDDDDEIVITGGKNRDRISQLFDMSIFIFQHFF